MSEQEKPLERRESEGQVTPKKRSADPAIEQQINENLRKLYTQVSAEPIPDKMMQLLDRLKQKEGLQ